MMHKNPCKKIGIVGYWATTISTVRTTILSKKGDKNKFISGFGQYFPDFGYLAVRFLHITPDSYGVILF